MVTLAAENVTAFAVHQEVVHVTASTVHQEVVQFAKKVFRGYKLYPFPVTASLVSLPLTNSFSSSLYRDWIDDVGICVGSDGGGDIDVGGDDDEAVQCSSHEQ
uniref:Uncharacterized protein n=1 Tax=Glossina austeni TaxID=7395 RepID=A0A1A9V2J0_GLOAU